MRAPKFRIGRILEFLEEDNGGLSATRLIFILWGTVSLGVWAFVSIKTTVIQPMPESIVTLLGIWMTGKVAQKLVEKAQ